MLEESHFIQCYEIILYIYIVLCRHARIGVVFEVTHLIIFNELFHWNIQTFFNFVFREMFNHYNKDHSLNIGVPTGKGIGRGLPPRNMFVFKIFIQ